MAVDAKGGWIGFGVGDTDPGAKRTDPNWHAVSLINEKLYDRFQATHVLGQKRVSNVYDAVTAESVKLIAKNYNMTVPVDLQGNAVANLAFRAKIGAYPPPAPPTHALLSVRGTGGIIGQDYTSQVAQVLPGIYHEHPMDYLAAMGGLPVGAANDPSAPSGNECAEQACQLLTDTVMGSTVTFSIAGYSLGTKGVILFLNNLFDPNHFLYQHRDRLVAVLLIADPWRPFGKSFFMGPVQAGQGIGTPYFTMSKAAQDALGWRCCWLVNPADLYTDAPLGGTGMVLADFEETILGTAVSDPLGTMMKFVQLAMKLITKDGGLQTIFGGAGGMGLISGIASGSTLLTGGIAALLLPILLGGFQGLISGVSGNGANLPAGVAADVQAAILALKFFGSGTGPHLAYHVATWGPTPQTFLQLGIQHLADWGNRVPVLT